MTESQKSKRRVYFDHNATTYMRREVIEAMMPCFRERFGNASSLHFFGQESRSMVNSARESCASLIGAEPEELVFTSGGTESNNIAIRGTVKTRRRPGSVPHVVISNVEHPAVLRTCESLEKDGVEVTYVPCTENGVVRLDVLEQQLRHETVLVSVMLANNETGVVQPIKEISALTRAREIVFHVDAVQGVGKIPVDVNDLGVELLSISSHKFYGPKGIGALYVRRGTPLVPVYSGGSHEFGLRPGTENVPGIVGFGESCRISRENLPREMDHINRLRERLERGILEGMFDVKVNGIDVLRLPNTSSVSVSRVEGEAITLNLSVLGFAVSSGSACASGDNEPSHVLLAMGLDRTDALGGIRISLGIENTDEDVDAFLVVFPGIIERLRELSPLKERS